MALKKLARNPNPFLENPDFHVVLRLHSFSSSNQENFSLIDPDSKGERV